MDWAPLVDHSAMYKAAIEKNVPLVVFINTPPRTIPGTLSYWTADFFGRKDAQVLVGYPKGKHLLELPLKVGVTDEEIHRQIKKVTSAGRGEFAIGKRTFVHKDAKGHTHTCSHGHTWDHTMDRNSHNCPFCGEHATIVDSTKKQVTVEVNGPVVRAPVVRAVEYPISVESFYRRNRTADCPNGNCPYVR